MVFKQRLIDCFKQDWEGEISSRDRYAFYSSFRNSPSLCDYLTKLKHFSIRREFTRLRLGVSPLKTHQLRYKKNVVVGDFDCPFCPGLPETEYHFILVCPVYAMLREKHIQAKFWKHPAVFRLTLLFSIERASVVSSLATYIFEAMRLRASQL